MKFDKSAFDDEYSTCFLVETRYLKDNGILYSFVKTNDKGVNIFKYKKTRKLFLALAEFYKNK